MVFVGTKSGYVILRSIATRPFSVVIIMNQTDRQILGYHTGSRGTPVRRLSADLTTLPWVLIDEVAARIGLAIVIIDRKHGMFAAGVRKRIE